MDFKECFARSIPAALRSGSVSWMSRLLGTALSIPSTVLRILAIRMVVVSGSQIFRPSIVRGIKQRSTWTLPPMSNLVEWKGRIWVWVEHDLYFVRSRDLDIGKEIVKETGWSCISAKLSPILCDCKSLCSKTRICPVVKFPNFFHWITKLCIENNASIAPNSHTYCFKNDISWSTFLNVIIISDVKVFSLFSYMS
jgi:hypothetical protein